MHFSALALLFPLLPLGLAAPMTSGHVTSVEGQSSELQDRSLQPVPRAEWEAMHQHARDLESIEDLIEDPPEKPVKVPVIDQGVTEDYSDYPECNGTHYAIPYNGTHHESSHNMAPRRNGTHHGGVAYSGTRPEGKHHNGTHFESRPHNGTYGNYRKHNGTCISNGQKYHITTDPIAKDPMNDWANAAKAFKVTERSPNDFAETARRALYATADDDAAVDSSASVKRREKSSALQSRKPLKIVPIPG